MQTDAALHPAVDVRLESEFGLLHLPAVDAAVSIAPVLPAKTKRLRGSLRALIVSLSAIEFRVDHAQHPQLNTQAKGKAPTDKIRLTIDKHTATAHLPDPSALGHVTVFEFPVAILAVNDRPRVAVPSGLQVRENELVAVGGVSVTDIDADEIPLGSADGPASGACPTPAGEA